MEKTPKFIIWNILIIGYLEESAELMKEENIYANKLVKENDNLKEDNDYLVALLNDDSHLTPWNEEKGTYSTQMTECVMKLLNLKVSSNNIGEVVEAVADLCGKVPDKWPSRQTVDRMSDRRLSLATKQLDSIAEKINLTYYLDETSKYGKSFKVFAVTDKEKNSYVLGLREMYSKK